ncbi:hypothetical protein GGS21DRAFT_400906 [Xylaria nigripes]|nr:hypothetical protein GGS21DRAFT_400906 [Xylaria nigripes]
MSSTGTSSSSSSTNNNNRRSSRHYDTGFPDSFASRTTSMRHPDAIVDPGFAISGEHIDSAKSMHRSLMSLLHKHRRTMSLSKSSEGAISPTSTSGFSDADSAADLAHDHFHGAEAEVSHLALDADEGEERRGRSMIFRKLISKE